MRRLKHLPSIAFALIAIAFLLWFFRVSITSFDLRPWLVAFLFVSWLSAFSLGCAASRQIPSRFRGITTGIISVAVGVLLFLAVGWPSAEYITSTLRELRGFQSDLGTTYFYHDFSGAGTGDLFNFYGETLKTALVATGFSLFVALIVCPILGIPYLFASTQNEEKYKSWNSNRP